MNIPSKSRGLIAASVAGLALATFGLAPALAETPVEAQINVPAKVFGTVTGACDHRGSKIELDPSVLLGNVEVTVLFDGGGAHDKNVSEQATLQLQLLGGAIILPKQPAFGGVTGNPKISIWIGDQQLLAPTRCNKL